MSEPGRSIRVMTGGGHNDNTGGGPTATSPWARDTVWASHPAADAVPAESLEPGPRPRTQSRQRWALWGMVALGCICSAIAISLSVVNSLGSTETTTITSTIASTPTYSESEVAAAKTDACSASLTVDEPLTTVQKALAAIPDRGTPEAQDALSRYQMVTIVETEFLKSQTRPAAPESVREGVNHYVAALLAEVDGATRGLSDAEMNHLVGETKAAGEALAAACR